MPFHFCPQCGTKLQPDFKFCPSCGGKLLCPDDEAAPVTSTASLSVSPPRKAEAATAVFKSSLATSTSCEPMETHTSVISPPVTTRPALRKTRNSHCLDREVTFSIPDVASLEVPASDEKIKASPRSGGGKKLAEKTSRKAETLTVDASPRAASSPGSSAASRSPLKGKSKAKKGKQTPAVEPLQEGEEVTDTTGKKWKLVKLLTQNTTELVYEVSRSSSMESNHILKLGTKDGRIFNEQNFLQRAAKPASVDKWIKQNKMDFLGIPSCVGFGLHADSYRFLIFPSMGQSLQSVMEDEEELLTEKVVLQLACRILDVLQYLHSNEYVHADINAENIYIQPGQKSQVYLVGYCHAFRYCPGGQHVEYREASRTPHEGAIEFISLDAHKGAAPSRRSDLQSLGYCMLRWHTGMLPWSSLTQPDQVATQKQRFMEDVPALLRHCFGRKGVSGAFQKYLTAVMTLPYTEQPDYAELKAGLVAALRQLGGSLEEPLSF